MMPRRLRHDLVRRDDRGGLNGILARVFVWQEIIVPHANQKVRDGRLADEAVEAFLLDGIDAFLQSLDARSH